VMLVKGEEMAAPATRTKNPDTRRGPVLRFWLARRRQRKIARRRKA
jgi:hypothetical protein